MDDWGCESVNKFWCCAGGVLQVEVIPWAAERAADCRTVLQRRLGVERLGSKVVLQMELLQLLQQAQGPPIQAEERNRVFLRASFRPDPNLAEGGPVGTMLIVAPQCTFPSHNAYMTSFSGSQQESHPFLAINFFYLLVQEFAT